MMSAFTTRPSLRRPARLAIAGAAILAAAHGASASDDSGVHDFFASIFGGDQPQAAAPAASVTQPAHDGGRPSHFRPRAHALTVKLRRAKPRLLVAQAPAKAEKVSIFEDRSLRRGDAVMTGQGIRIFAGSTAWPYSARDFVGLDDADQLSKQTTKVLAQLDRMPRG